MKLNRHQNTKLFSFFCSTMGIDLYYVPGSAPCRAVLLAAKALGVELNLKYCDLMKGEHLTPEFIKVGFCNFHNNRNIAWIYERRACIFNLNPPFQNKNQYKHINRVYDSNYSITNQH